MAFGNGGGSSGTISGSSDVLLSAPATNDTLLYNQPTQKWVNAPTVVPPATATSSGIVELATNSESIAGADTARAVTPAGLKAVADTKAPVATAIVIVNHGGAASTARPAGAPAVYWIGTVVPTNMTAADLYNGPAV